MSKPKNTKPANNVETPATRAATSAASKLASFAANNSQTSSKKTPAAPAVVDMDQLSVEFAKQRTSLKEDVSSLIQEAIKPLQTAMDNLQSTMKSFQGRLTSVESVAGDNFERVTGVESTIKNASKP